MKHDRRADLILGALAGLTVAVVFLGDLWTPSEIDFSPLAAVPVAVAAWFAPRTYPLVLGFAVLLSFVAVLGGGISFESGAAAVVSCVGLAVVIRLAARARQASVEPAADWLRRLFPTIPPAQTGARPHHQPLTRREREVVELAADGLTAREIAAALFIGERTVETHLANSYAKLGISSKRELIMERVRSHTA